MSHDQCWDPATLEILHQADGLPEDAYRTSEQYELVAVRPQYGNIAYSEPPWSAPLTLPLPPWSSHAPVASASCDTCDGMSCDGPFLRPTSGVDDLLADQGYTTWQDPSTEVESSEDTAIRACRSIEFERFWPGLEEFERADGHRWNSTLHTTTQTEHVQNPESFDLSGYSTIPDSHRTAGDDVRLGQHLRGTAPLIPASSVFDNYLGGLSEPIRSEPTWIELMRSEHKRSSTSVYSVSSLSTSESLRCLVGDCSSEFSGKWAKTNLARHMRLKHRNNYSPYRCEAHGCSRTFKRQDARLKHYRKQHPELGPSQMLIRGSARDSSKGEHQINSPSEIRDEPQGHFSATPISASANEGFEVTAMHTAPSTPTTVVSEPRTIMVRAEGDSIQCEICEKSFGRVAELRRHMASFHDPDPPKFFCIVPGCSRVEPFPRKDKLLDHVDKVHARSGPTALSEDSKAALQTSFRCTEHGCDRVFNIKADLLRHQRIHTAKSERPYRCQLCGESFLYPKDLKRHEATHLHDYDRAKPMFYCKVAGCDSAGGQGFSRKDALTRHLKRFHPELVEDKEET